MEIRQKLNSKERYELTQILRKKHISLLNAIGKPDAVFIPKMAHRVKGLPSIYMGFFESELSGGDVYTEKVSKQMESEDETRTLYKARYNPHFKEEYSKSEPLMNGDCRYYIPIEELEIVEAPNVSIKTVIAPEEFDLLPHDPDKDLPMDQMTMRDYAAIHMREPVSIKAWLNEIITNANQNPY